jgi:hypothetical protein
MFFTVLGLTLALLVIVSIQQHLFTHMENKTLITVAAVATGIALALFFTTVLLMVLLLY